MKLFGWKSAGRAAARPALTRGVAWGWQGSEVPRSYEARVRDGYLSNPVAQRAVRMVSEGVASAPLSTSDDAVLTLITARSAGQVLIETMAMQLLLHGNEHRSRSAGEPGLFNGGGDDGEWARTAQRRLGERADAMHARGGDESSDSPPGSQPTIARLA